MADIIYDSIIIGAGPAGLGAALYNSRDRLQTLVIDKFFPGGQILNTDRIENYPGYEVISGAELVEKMFSQAQKFGAEFETGTEVKNMQRLNDGKIRITCDKKPLSPVQSSSPAEAITANSASQARLSSVMPAQASVIAEPATPHFSRAEKSSPSEAEIPLSKKLCTLRNSPPNLPSSTDARNSGRQKCSPKSLCKK